MREGLTYQFSLFAAMREKGLRVESLAIVDGMDAETQTIQFRE